MKKAMFMVVGIALALSITSCGGSSSNSSSYNTSSSTSQQVEDYSDIEQQVEICERAKQHFLEEVDNVFVKASSPQYQGIMAQKIFWEANDALDDFNREGEKLERLLRKHGFTDEANAHKSDREYLNQVYREEKRKAQGYR